MLIPLGFLPTGSEWIWIALVVVLLFGAKKLPELARGIGKSLGEFRKAKSEFDREINDAIHSDDSATKPKETPASVDRKD
jgi:TatA/E family protein of Tat protein translocase